MTSRAARIGWGGVGIIAILVAMQLAVDSGFVSRRTMPSSVEMLSALGTLLVSQTFLLAIVNTLVSAVLAFAIAAGLMVPLGILLGSSPACERAFSGLIEVLRPVPAVSLLPVAILAFGTGLELKMLLAAYAALWPILVNTVTGVRDTDANMVRAARSFLWNRATIMRRVQLPSALPFIGSGARQSISVALVIVVTVELLGAQSGIGAVVRDYGAAGRADYVFAGVLATALLGLALHTLLARGEQTLMRWAPQYRKVAR